MKLVILLTLLFGGAFCSTLKEATNELVQLLPVDRLRDLADKHLKNNGDIQRLMSYLKTSDFQQLISQIRANPSTKELEKYLQDEGIDTNEIVESAEEYINDAEVGEGGNLKMTDAVTDLLNALPMDRIKTFVISHITDPWFVTLVGRVRKVIEGLSNVPALQPLINHVKESGLLKFSL